MHLVGRIANRLVLQRVALRVGQECGVMIAAILMGLAKRKRDVDAGHMVNIECSKLGLHTGEFIIAECVGLEICETVPGIPLPRRNICCRLV